MKSNTSKRYDESIVKELFKNAIKLSSNERYTTFTQLAKVQNVFRKTYLDQVRRYDHLKPLYDLIRKNLERNIVIEIESGLISKNKGTLMLWNHRK